MGPNNFRWIYYLQKHLIIVTKHITSSTFTKNGFFSQNIILFTALQNICLLSLNIFLFTTQQNIFL